MKPSALAEPSGWRLQSLKDANVLMRRSTAENGRPATPLPAAPSRVSDYQMGQKVEVEMSGRSAALAGKFSANLALQCFKDMYLAGY